MEAAPYVSREVVAIVVAFMKFVSILGRAESIDDEYRDPFPMPESAVSYRVEYLAVDLLLNWSFLDRISLAFLELIILSCLKLLWHWKEGYPGALDLWYPLIPDVWLFTARFLSVYNLLLTIFNYPYP